MSTPMHSYKTEKPQNKHKRKKRKKKKSQQSVCGLQSEKKRMVMMAFTVVL
jgi:hypothetical protein